MYAVYTINKAKRVAATQELSATIAERLFVPRIPNGANFAPRPSANPAFHSIGESIRSQPGKLGPTRTN